MIEKLKARALENSLQGLECRTAVRTTSSKAALPLGIGQQQRRDLATAVFADQTPRLDRI